MQTINITVENNLPQVTEMKDVVEKITVTMSGIESVELQRWVTEAIVTTCMERAKEGKWDANMHIENLTLSGGGND